MSYDALSQFYACLNFPLPERILELTRIIDSTNHAKELQAIFPQLINNIFSSAFNSGWGLRTATQENSQQLFDLLISFLEPQGPMFRLCYKLLADPLLKYNLSLSMLPQNLQMSIESGRCPQFYADMVNMDAQIISIVSLALNPFDYYIFQFALHLVHNDQSKNSWENWNSVYFAVACDYLMHFLPSDPNIPILPVIHNYSGKVPSAVPLQTVNRPSSPSLLLIPDISGISNQHTSQNQSRNETWRSETVLQVFVDIWMCIEDVGYSNFEMYQRNFMCVTVTSSPERVRTVRVLVKHIHSYSAKHLSDPVMNSSELRKYARKIVCTRGYHYIQHLVSTWPLDASFRLVMELWLSLIQPWRYTNNTINQDRFPSTPLYQEEGSTCALDASYVQFIAENFPTYTCIFQLVLPRFMRLDLTAYKNAVLLFRLGKVFSQQHLVAILKELEEAICNSTNGGYSSLDTSWNNNSFDQSYNNMSTKKWVALAKQSLTELNLSTTFQYEPVWKDNNRTFLQDFITKIITARNIAEKNINEQYRRKSIENQGLWSSVKNWLMIENTDQDQITLEECKKVPTYLTAAIHHFSHIFDLTDISMVQAEDVVDDNSLEQSLTNTNLNNLSISVTNKLRSKQTNIQYMGDPDLMPITSYENTIVVRILYQLSTRLNEIYSEQFSNAWNRGDLLGYIAREILEKPITIHSYVKDSTNHQQIVRQNLPPRLTFRKLGSHKVIIWLCIGYFLFKLFSYNGFTYLLTLIGVYACFIITKALVKALRIVQS